MPVYSAFTMPLDHGPIYMETIPGRFPVEPWNTFSNLSFLMVILFFAWRTGFNRGRYPIIVASLPILLAGFAGGTLYHATRASDFWFLLDILPIVILVLLASLHFWQQLLHKFWLSGILVFAPVVVTRYFLVLLQPSVQIGISVEYMALAATILLPAVIHCLRSHWSDISYLILGSLSFIIAIVCRILDSARLLPMGTHFLWHMFGALSTFYILYYILRSYERTASPAPAPDGF